MKAASFVLSALALSFSGFAHAGGDYPEPYMWEGGPAKSRAEVIAELKDAQAKGQLSVGEGGYPFVTSADSSKSRAEVVGEMEEAGRLGLLFSGEAGPKAATPEQEQSILSAGHRAASQVRVAQSRE